MEVQTLCSRYIMALWATSPKRASLVLIRQTASSEHSTISLSTEDGIVDPEARISLRLLDDSLR